MSSSHRIGGITLPLNILQNDNMIKFLKTNGFITLMKYCDMIVDEYPDEFVTKLLASGYVVAIATSDELNMSIGVSRKGLGEFHKAFERLKIAKVYSTSFGYVVILGKQEHGINRFFIGDPKMYKNEIEIIQNINDGVSLGNVSLGNTYNNSISIEPNIIPERRVIKKVKKLKVKVKEEDKKEEKEEEKPKKKKGALDQLKKATEKVKKDSGEYEQSIKKRETSKANPSQKKIYQQHKSKEVEDWNCEDFLGYYLNEFVEMLGMEDVDFVNVSRTKTKTILMNMGKFKKDYFSKSNEEFKSYIKWAMEFINDPKSWIDSPVSIYSIVYNKLSKTLVKDYFYQKTKSKIKNRVKEDSEYSEKDYWQKKYL